MAKMAALVSLLSLFAIVVVQARNIRLDNTDFNGGTSSATKNFTYVCDPDRYTSLGLDMSQYPFCDTSLSYETRAADLVNHLTLFEKVAQLGNTATGVSRIGLPKYEWWSEALHGVSNVGPGTYFDPEVPGATSFPTVILSAASFNASLWRTIGQAVSTEARAMYNLGRAGLTYWSPNINVVRDPRWGRAIETPGEDPYTVGMYAVNYVRGLQDVEGAIDNYTDPNSRPLKVSSCCKHYAAYDVDNWDGIQRYTFDARVTEQDMEETFLRPFEMCIKEGDVSSIMCSYNRVNGIPTCADPKLLNQTVRGKWDLHGYIVSDCDSIEVMVDDHKWLQDSGEDAVSQTLKAGLDLDCGNFYPKFTASAVEQGKVAESNIDISLNYLYVVLMRLGWFDGQPAYESLGKDDVCSDKNIELATEAAREGIVLLKNNAGTLPLSKSNIKTLAVVGPHSNATGALIGNYAGIPCRIVTPLEGLSSYASVDYQIGCSDVHCTNDSLIFPAAQAAKKADATIIFAGIDLSVEAESLDRTDLLLPGYQTQFINQVADAASGPVVLVIFSAGGVDIGFARDNPKIGAILWAGYPGEEGGHAIAQVIYGQYNPGGRLPLTWHEAGYVDMLPMTSMPLRPVDSLGYPGRTYRFFNGSTVFPFGFGLSYTNFTYTLGSNIVQSKTIALDKWTHCHPLSYGNESYIPGCSSVRLEHLPCDAHAVEFDVKVENTGSVDGNDVVLVYSFPPNGIDRTYIKQLIAFERVFVPAGGSQTVHFSVPMCKGLRVVDYNAYSVVPSGTHTIVVGDGAVSYPLTVSFTK